ncbi:MAG: methionyl-tRNA formyltransferase [Candidatus Dojkabacteria bacterium]
MDKIKTIFIGSGEFAVPVLEKLLKVDFIDLGAVVTQPDKPVGRKQILTPTPVGEYVSQIENLKLKILKPNKIREISDELLEEHQPDLIIVASYGQMIPSNMLQFPRYGCLNLHGSLLPLLRGAVPVQMSILQGFKETGVTLQLMAEKLDEGDMVALHKIAIGGKDNSEDLMKKLANLAAATIEKDVKDWIERREAPIVQDKSLATYCSKEDLSKEKAEIKFNTDILQAERMIRAFYPWPIAWFRLPDGKTLKIYKARYDELLSKNVGDFHKLNKHDGFPFIMRAGKNLYLVLQNGVLDLTEIQLEGKQKRGAAEYFFLAN